MQETIYVGLDLGSSVCQQTVMSGDGGRRFSRSFATSEKSLRTAFDKLEGDVRVHMEAGELASWVQSILKPLVAEVVVSHPRSLAWIGKDSVKDDKVDAGKLAELLRIGRVHEVYCEEDTRRRTFKHLVTHHEQTSREQARAEIEDQSPLKDFGRYPQGRPAFFGERPSGFARIDPGTGDQTDDSSKFRRIESDARE